MGHNNPYITKYTLEEFEALIALNGLDNGRIYKITDIPAHVMATSTNTYVSLISNEPAYELLFEWLDITQVDTMLGGSRFDIANWNTFFGLPGNGTPFTEYTEQENYSNLIGGDGISLFGAFTAITNLLKIVDNKGAFAIINDNAFWSCSALTEVLFNKVTRINGINSFRDCRALKNFHFPELLNISGTQSFWNCSGNPSKYYMPKVVQFGSSTGDNSLFAGVFGIEIEITIPSAINSDLDIVNLQANNTVTIINT